jgi:hypothetical protein
MRGITGIDLASECMVPALQIHISPSVEMVNRPGAKSLRFHRAVLAGCVIEDRLVRITGIADFGPVQSRYSESGKKRFPSRRKVFIKDQHHDARSS